MFSVEGKIVVITGAASGIGTATARRFAAAGATVVVSDIADGSAVADEVGGTFVAADVSDEAQVEALVRAAVEQHGRLDVMVNNAGIIGPGRGIAADSMDDVRHVLEINLLGAIHGTRHAARVMQPGGAIVSTASMAGVVGFPGLTAYGASKWGVVGLTKHAAVEFGPKGIRVNCVCPTGVSTPMAGDLAGHWAVQSQSLANQHVSRLATAEEVAAAIHYLACDDAAMVNGHALHVDGGLDSGLSVQLIEAATGQTIHDDEGIFE
jgi:NAD(P)-dependent dehydrogenase (short-subunit alcohol dehydrogenase family)